MANMEKNYRQVHSAPWLRAPGVDVIGIGQGFTAPLAGPYPDDIFHRVDEDDPVTFLPRASGLHERRDGRLHVAFAEDDIELNLGQHVLVQVRVPPGVFVAAEPAMPADLEHVHSNDPDS